MYILVILLLILVWYYLRKQKENKKLIEPSNNHINKNLEFNYGTITNNLDLNNFNKFNNSNKFISNLNTWYSNTWIDSLDENGNPIYKSSNTDINESTILVNKDVENIDFISLGKNNNNKSISQIYDNLIQDYKIY
jgi:hypothetical protein